MNKFDRAAEFITKFSERNKRFKNLSYQISAHPLDEDHHGNPSDIADKTASIALEHEELRKKLAVADSVAESIDYEIASYIVYAVCQLDPNDEYSFLTKHGMRRVGAERFIRDLIAFYRVLPDALEHYHSDEEGTA